MTLVTTLLAVTLTTAPAAAEDELAPVYHLPAPAGTTLTVAQGNGEPDSHPDERFAFDFTATDGQPAASRWSPPAAARS